MSLENSQQVPHVVQDDIDEGSGPNSNSASSQGMFGDASDESGQIHAIEQIEDDIMEAVNNPMPNANSQRMEGNDASEEINQISSFGQVDDVSVGMSLEGAMSTSSTEPSSTAFSRNGDYEELYSELVRADGRQFRRWAVVWQHIQEDIFSSAYVCPFSGECFLSGHCIDEIGYVRRDEDLQWYDSKEMAQVAAISRKIDCSSFRELSPDSSPEGNRRCREIPYRHTIGQVLPSAIPEDARQRIQVYQQRAWEAGTPSVALTNVSPLTPPVVGPPTLRPPEEDDEMSPLNGVLMASLADKNARLVLNERYQSGVVNGHYVLQCSIPEANFLFHVNGTSHQPYYTCIFVCPLFGECYASGEPHRDRSSTYLMHGLKWFRHKKQAKFFAAARAIDCLEYRQGNPNGERYCTEEPFAQDNGPALDMRWQRVFSAKIQRLQVDARERLQRFSRQT